MMNFLRTLPIRRPALLAAAVLGLLAAPSLRAAEQNPDFDIHFGVKAGVDLGASFKLRPTVQQPLFVWVLNNSNNDVEDVTVELLADGAPVEGTVQHVAVKKKSKTQVVFGKPAAGAAAPVPPPAPPMAPAPPAKPQPPVLQEVKAPLQVAVLDMAGKEKLVTADLPVARPEDYIQVTAISYNPDATWSEPGRTLIVKLKALGGFGAPASHVDLVLRPDRIPGLVDAPKEGNYSGYLGPNGELTLKAEKLKFKDDKETNGLVYLTVDGWERAFTFYTTFPGSGQAGQPTPIRNVPVVRLNVPEVANPGVPLPVAVEVDMNGPPAGKQVALAFDRTSNHSYSEENGDLVLFSGDRDVRMLAGIAPEGSLLLQPKVQDWKKEWDVSGVFGTRALQVQILKSGSAVDLYDSEDATGARSFEKWTTKDAVEKKVTLDAAPDDVKFTFDSTLKRGANLPVKAWVAADLDDVKHKTIKEVFFYVGRPGPDGAAPPTAQQVKGVFDPTIKKWAAVLPAPPTPTDQKGKVDVTATFVKATDVPANGTVTITLEDAAAPTTPGTATAAKGGSIAGVVVEGSLPQPGIEVRLLDDKGAVKDAVKTDAKGAYLFKDVAAGSYRVVSNKTVDSTKGETAVIVLDGKSRDGADINLQR